MTVAFENPDGSLTRDKDGHSFKRHANIDATSELDAELQLNARGVFFGSIYRNLQGEIPDPNVTCKGYTIDAIRAAVVGGVGYYKANITFGRANNGSQDEELIVGGRAIWTVEQTQGEVPVDTATDGQAMVNTAGTLLADIIAQDSGEILIATWLVAGVSFVSSLGFVRQFRNRVNSQIFLGALQRTVLCRHIQPEMIDRETLLVKYRARFEPAELIAYENVIVNSTLQPNFSASKWDVMRINRGLTQLNKDSDGNEKDPPIIPILQSAGENSTRKIPVQVPQLLDDQGVVLPPNSDAFRLYYPNALSVDFNAIQPLIL